DVYKRQLSRLLSFKRFTDTLDTAQRVDLRLSMVDDILVKVDRMSMYHSLEVRSPLLDHRVVTLALRIPPALRVLNGQNKYMLRRLASRVLPDIVANGPKKGFAVPLRDWFFSPDGKFFKDTLFYRSRRFPPLFRPGGAELLWNLARKNIVLDTAIFTALAYHWWCDAQQ
ncbi:MAG: asparagine synthase C-terminal domain-containing protein, partial [Verrucomicrobiae bacterium]|nr:asparagine synthase C-terminal domain-containing protein [Verrucomicrobiae bacterium]